MKSHKFFMMLWENPVFQRNYSRTRIKNAVPPKQAFIATLAVSFISNIVFILVFGSDPAERIGMAFWVSVVSTTGAMTLITYIRMFIICLTTTSIELRRDLDDGSLHLLFTAPISDNDLYYSEILPSFVKGLEVLNSLLTVLAGALIPFIFLNLPALFPYVLHFYDYGDEIIIGLLVLLMVFSGLVLMMLLFSLASGIHTLAFPTFGAVFATLIHYGIVSWLSYLIGGFGMAAVMEENYTSSGDVIGFAWFVGLKLVAVIIGCAIAGAWGRSAFARARRQGYYEPEHKTAAGLAR